MLFLSCDYKYLSVMHFYSRTFDDTVNRGTEFGESLRGGEAVLLVGPLGSGKTAFTKGIAIGLGIEDMVTSPSFSIMNIYEGKIKLYHFDFYRLDDPVEMEDLLQDYVYARDAVSVIEWGEQLQNRLPDFILIQFEILKDGRCIAVQRGGS